MLAKASRDLINVNQLFTDVNFSASPWIKTEEAQPRIWTRSGHFAKEVFLDSDGG